MGAGHCLYPFLVLASWLTDRPVFEREMHEILRQEILLSTRVGMLSDNVLPGGKGLELRLGAELSRGLDLELGGGEPVSVEVRGHRASPPSKPPNAPARPAADPAPATAR